MTLLLGPVFLPVAVEGSSDAHSGTSEDDSGSEHSDEEDADGDLEDGSGESTDVLGALVSPRAVTGVAVYKTALVSLLTSPHQPAEAVSCQGDIA